MPNVTFFSQECPTCGRRLQIRVDYLGKQVVCQHCHGRLIARDPAGVPAEQGTIGNALLRRADELLDTVERRRSGSPLVYPR
jgi:DNA-directed RNA polymerase subunit RPC12/RpoP